MDIDGNGAIITAAKVQILGPPAQSAYGYDINEFGDVTGGDTSSGIFRGFVYTDEGGFEDIGDLGGGSTLAYKINNLGQIAGVSHDADGNPRAFRYTPSTIENQPGIMENLGIIKAGSPSLYGNSSSGTDINDSGVVVGNASAGARKGSNKYHVFRDAGAGMEDLGTLGGPLSKTVGINSDEEIVGRAYDRDNQNVNFLYTDEIGMVALEPLITDLPADTEKFWVRGINDDGDICGTITYTDGTGEAFLLLPN